MAASPAWMLRSCSLASWAVGHTGHLRPAPVAVASRGNTEGLLVSAIIGHFFAREKEGDDPFSYGPPQMATKMAC